MASDPVLLARELIREESVTPDAGGALSLVARRLEALGFTVEVARFDDGGGPAVPNLYARLGDAAPNLCFAGHTDVVPAGDRAGWDHDPFAAVVEDGALVGRGAADMKSAIAAFVVAIERTLARNGGTLARGSLSLLLTGDEEGPAVNGTKRMLAHLAERGERLDYAIVGEPTSPTALGEMIKIGRRGSLHGVIRVEGTSGHVAYPHLADNPIPRLVAILHELTREPFDEGNAYFQPSNLEVLDLHVGNDADNVIPPAARARFNIRFNSEHTPESLMAEIRRRCDRAGARYHIDFRLSGDAFLTPPGFLSRCVVEAVEARLGRRPELSTTGGTSDARFLKDFCPVVEVGLVGATMHKANERVLTSDIEALTDIYQDIVRRVLDGAPAKEGTEA
jgi:succinyl-diaminopimelate desuccinylase